MVMVMEPPTEKQHRVFEFFQTCALDGRPGPTMREICQEFGFRSPRSATDHVNALIRKGLLERSRGRSARSVRLKDIPASAGIPLLGNIRAGLPEDAVELHTKTLPLSPKMFGISDASKAFALIVQGDSMEGCHLLDGDTVILETKSDAVSGNIVAAVIDGQCTLKTFLRSGSKVWLRAENPRYPDLIPADQLKIQGIVRAVLRLTVAKLRP